MNNLLFSFDNATIQNRNRILLHSISWKIHTGEAWLLTGGNGSGKSALAAALAGSLAILQNGTDEYPTTSLPDAAIASIEEAARLIREEREQDDSEFTEGGVDTGRTPADILGLAEPESHPAVIQCGIQRILHRGLKYLSTGEIRRTILAKTLAGNARIIILDEPFDGLDTDSRRELSHTIDRIACNPDQTLIVIQDREQGIPESVDKLLELKSGTVSFNGKRNLYSPKETGAHHSVENLDTEAIPEAYRSTEPENKTEPLVEMENVTVAWNGNRVLDNLSWTLRPGEHWLIRGPNGSGKTTFLELITGDNPQVFKNNIRLFGRPRGSGETIWEIKARMGIVSWRLHQEYRMTADLDIEGVLLSGLHDSIGLYQKRTSEQSRLAEKWLTLADFSGRGSDNFANLSYGEQRAILILRAAIKRPHILILDEPCHGLDAEHRQFVLLLLEKIASTGTTTLLHVTHDPEEVLPCEKHVLELQPGKSPMWKIISLP